MKIIKYIFIFFLVVIVFNSFKKYPEGGFRKRGPKTFITDKKVQWKLSLYEVNGIDSTYLIQTPIVNGNDFYKDFLCCNYIDKKDYGDLLLCGVHNYSYGTRFIHKNSEISFSTAYGVKGQCVSSPSGTSCQRNMFNPEGEGEVVFKIQKLKDNECILTTKLNNSYKIILTRKY